MRTFLRVVDCRAGGSVGSDRRGGGAIALCVELGLSLDFAAAFFFVFFGFLYCSIVRRVIVALETQLGLTSAQQRPPRGWL